MRELWINNTTFELEPEVSDELLASGAVYPCGEDHDLHLTPDHNFTIGEVILLLDVQN